MQDGDKLTARHVLDRLAAAVVILEELAAGDVSGLHVDAQWSSIPYPDDHLVFLRDQVSGLAASLREGPPPNQPRVAVVDTEGAM